MPQTNLPITINPNIFGGTPVFQGTRIPVKTFFEYLENDYSLDEFLDCFPTVPREQALAVSASGVRSYELTSLNLSE
ncbi:MAG: DUF433 domain-containing protein [Ignavibacteriales bacterium]|nr:DUF433 domain-containing protein [Ignavibacteriales bacterium]